MARAALCCGEIAILHTNMKMDSVSLFHIHNQASLLQVEISAELFHLLIATARGEPGATECAAADSWTCWPSMGDVFTQNRGGSQGRSNWLGGRLQRWAAALGKSEWMRSLRRGPVQSDRLALTSLPHQLRPAAWPGRNPHRRLATAGERKLGVSEVVPGKEVPEPGTPSRGHSCGLVVQSPLWSKVPQRVWQRAARLSFTGVTWLCTAGGCVCEFVCFPVLGGGGWQRGHLLFVEHLFGFSLHLLLFVCPCLKTY